MDSFLVFLSISKIVFAHGVDNNGDNESDSLSESRSIEKPRCPTQYLLTVSWKCEFML